MEKMTFNELLESIQVYCSIEREVVGISDDSRKILKDWLFICRHGVSDQGERYVGDVLSKGGIVLWESEDRKACYHVDSIEDSLPILLNTYYHHPCRHLCVIGVTGTNGKTSVTLILQQLLSHIGKTTMVIGTNHIRYLDQDEYIDNTTPSACTLAYYFAKAVELHLAFLIMEVSSHAIDQKRISFIRFDHVLYTNIARDHLDYHITRTHYMYTKFKLRDYLKRRGVIIINHDVAELHPLYHLSDYKIITFGLTQAHLQIHQVSYTMQSVAFYLEDISYQMKLLGMMNVYNVVEALIVLHRLHIPVKQRQLAVSSLRSIAGRLEVIPIKDYVVWLDYAHTDSALKEILTLASDVKQAKLICVVGCGGDRDKEKRSMMAQLALMYSDYTIFTADNPRSEEVHMILYDMLKDNVGNYEIRENRAYAIKYAMKIAQTHDIIVIAGKGDEATQTVNGKKYPLQDRELVERYSKMEEQVL